MKLFFSIILILSFAGIFLFLFFSTFETQFTSDRVYYGNINNAPLRINIADTPDLRYKGLSDTQLLPEHHGLLFVFPENGKYGITMRDMNYPIDILWFDERLRVVHKEERVAPDTYPRAFFPKANARYILETNAGFIEENGIREGARLSLVGYNPVLFRLSELFTF